MDRVRVASSNITSVGHDPATSTLEIEFHDAAVYRYSEVPERHFQGLVGAASVGGYFHRHIKGRYRYRRVW
jgi:hypothetical protein